MSFIPLSSLPQVHIQEILHLSYYFIFMHVEELGLAAFWEQEQRLLGERLARYNLQHDRRLRELNRPQGEDAAAKPQGDAAGAAYTQDQLVKDVVGYLRDEESK